MSSITKFVVFLSLAGVLTVLFSFVPGGKPRSVHTEKAMVFPVVEELPPTPAQPVVAPKEEKKAAKGTGAATKTENNFSSKVKMPAIRGANNYGWVELPRGTEVNLVRQSADGLWVRWDGNVVKVPAVVAATGALVVR